MAVKFYGKQQEEYESICAQLREIEEEVEREYIPPTVAQNLKNFVRNNVVSVYARSILLHIELFFRNL
jgi:hypothetical protein